MTAGRVTPNGSAPTAVSGRRATQRRGARLGVVLLAHWPLVVLMTLGALLRAAVAASYWPAWEFNQDSFDYLGDARHLNPNVARPEGYPVFLRGLSSITTQLAVVPIVQHVLALVIAVLVYAVVRRQGAGRWWGTVAAAPLLLDSYQIAVEQFVVAETLFEFLVAAAFAVLLWHRRPGWRAAASAGALLSAATLTRSVGVVLLLPAGLVLLLSRGVSWRAWRLGWLPTAAFAAACAVFFGGYIGWFRSVHGTTGTGAYNGYFLLGRVMTFGNCEPLQLTAQERALCDTSLLSARRPPGDFTWASNSPLRHPGEPPGPLRNQEAGHIAVLVMLHQPRDYAGTVVHDLLHYFSPGRHSGRMDGPVQTLQFPVSYVDSRWRPLVEPADHYLRDWNYPGRVVQYGRLPARYGFSLEQLHPTYNRSLPVVLQAYQRVGYTPGPLLALAAVLGLLGALARRVGAARLRLPGLALALAGLLSLLLPALTAGFDYRYMLPTLVLLPPAGALGALALLGRGHLTREHRR